MIGRDLARTLAGLAEDLNRQIGLLIQRTGSVETVIIGTHDRIEIPALTKVRTSGERLCGLRCVHTHFSSSGPDEEDIMDMVCLRLDMMSVLSLDDGLLHSVHIQPSSPQGWERLDASQDSCLERIEAIETQLARQQAPQGLDRGQDRAVLISVSTRTKAEAASSMFELAELARAAKVEVTEQVIQHRNKLDSRFILGSGKLMEIILICLRTGANLLIFDQELSPSQVRSITSRTDLRVIDRTQLILDIFASRALSREGKVQVEMAQLKYLLPFLATRDDALSRLTGGIGTRGPGETKLEIDRRRIKDRIARLSQELQAVGKQRWHRRSRRRKHEMPVLSLVGYTNAGKSTLLNTLTGSQILAEDLLFATLDPTSRRFRLPQGTEVVLTDTVGFIRNLPAALLKAFAATLEELSEADILLHVIDRANPTWKEQAEVVDLLLHQLDLSHIPCLRLYNKADLLEYIPETTGTDFYISANNGIGIKELLQAIEVLLNKK